MDLSQESNAHHHMLSFGTLIAQFLPVERLKAAQTHRPGSPETPPGINSNTLHRSLDLPETPLQAAAASSSACVGVEDAPAARPGDARRQSQNLTRWHHPSNATATFRQCVRLKRVRRWTLNLCHCEQ